jgi:phosphomevalonate kinase
VRSAFAQDERLMTARATAPGKVMLAGEYGVLDGGLAVLAAVNRRAIARRVSKPPPLSPFLAAARDVVRAVLGEEAAAVFDSIEVDTRALADGQRKLGLGSSAAATVAAVRLAAGDLPDVDVPLIIRLALDAHARAQAGRGAAGSGADVVAVAHGGVIGFRAGAVRRLEVPAGLRIHFAWTGAPADTATLVAAVNAARANAAAAAAATSDDVGLMSTATPVDHALAAITATAEALATAFDAADAAGAIDAVAGGARAMDELAAATGVALVPPSVAALAARLAPLGAACKTTGAGGGDVLALVAPASVTAAALDTAIVETGLWPLHLAVDPTGVDFHADGG